MKQNIKWTVVAAELEKKSVNVEIEITGIPGIGKVSVKKTGITYDQFAEMLDESAGVKLEARRIIPAKSVSRKAKRKYKKREEKLKEIETGKEEFEAETGPEEEGLRKTIEKEEKELENKGYQKIGSVSSSRGTSKRMKTNVYYKKERFYARSLTSKRRKMYSLNKQDYEKIMQIVNVMTESEEYISLQNRLGNSLQISANRFYAWTCIARALGHIEESYNRKKGSTMIRPTGKFTEFADN